LNISQLKIYLSSKSSLKAFIYLIILTKHSTLKKQVHKNVEMKLWNKITGIYIHTHVHTFNAYTELQGGFVCFYVWKVVRPTELVSNAQLLSSSTKITIGLFFNWFYLFF